MDRIGLENNISFALWTDWTPCRTPRLSQRRLQNVCNSICSSHHSFGVRTLTTVTGSSAWRAYGASYAVEGLLKCQHAKPYRSIGPACRGQRRSPASICTARTATVQLDEQHAATTYPNDSKYAQHRLESLWQSRSEVSAEVLGRDSAANNHDSREGNGLALHSVETAEQVLDADAAPSNNSVSAQHRAAGAFTAATLESSSKQSTEDQSTSPADGEGDALTASGQQVEVRTASKAGESSGAVELSPSELQRRAKISKANKGKLSWNMGKKHSPETLKKIRAGVLRAMKRPEVIEKLRRYHRPLQHSAETKAKIRAGVTASKANKKWLAELSPLPGKAKKKRAPSLKSGSVSGLAHEDVGARAAVQRSKSVRADLTASWAASKSSSELLGSAASTSRAATASAEAAYGAGAASMQPERVTSARLVMHSGGEGGSSSPLAMNVLERFEDSIVASAALASADGQALTRAQPRVAKPNAEGSGAKPPRRYGPRGEEHRRRISEAIKRKWQDPKYRAKATAGSRKQGADASGRMRKPPQIRVASEAGQARQRPAVVMQAHQAGRQQARTNAGDTRQGEQAGSGDFLEQKIARLQAARPEADVDMSRGTAEDLAPDLAPSNQQEDSAASQVPYVRPEVVEPMPIIDEGATISRQERREQKLETAQRLVAEMEAALADLRDNDGVMTSDENVRASVAEARELLARAKAQLARLQKNSPAVKGISSEDQVNGSSLNGHISSLEDAILVLGGPMEEL